MPKLTKPFIDNLQRPQRGQLIVRDVAQPGFGVRLTPKSTSYVAEGRMNGKSKRVTIGGYTEMSVEDARSEAKRILAEMASGGQPRPPAVEIRLTLRSALDRFLVARPIKPETKVRYRRIVEMNLADWMELPLTEITKNMVEQKHRLLAGPTRCGTNGESRANSTFEVLRVVMKWAADRYPMIQNPVERLNQNRQWFKLQPRQGTIPDNRLADFYQGVMAEPKIGRDFLLLILFSALRRREAGRLKWDDIDWEKKTLTVPMTKSKRMHVLPLTKMLIAILESRKGNGSEYVFEGRYGSHLTIPRASWDRLRRLLGWQWLIHDLRRTAISAGEKAGVPFLALKVIAGHSVQRSVTERYVVLDAEFVREHMERMNQRLLERMGATIDDWKARDVGMVAPQIKSIQVVETEDEEVYW